MTRSAGHQRQGITISPIGGLGNQLFIYAAGYAAASMQGCPLYIDDSWFATQTLRQYELNTFDSIGTMAVAKITRSYTPRSRPAGFTRRILTRFDVPPFRTISEETSFAFSPEVLSASPGVRLNGYLQSYKYFEDVKDQIREQLYSPVDPSPWFLETQNTLTSMGPWIAVHVRRGDYLNKGTRDVHGIVSGSYYSDALQMMRTLIPDATPVIFSDDPESSRQMLGGEYPNTIFMASPPTSKSIESVILMSLSAGAVIANSSFSWWGAWLGDRANRPVIAPRPWMDDPNVHERDLFPAGWLTLGRKP